MKLTIPQLALLRAATVCLLATSIGACSPPQPGSPDYRVAFPIEVVDKTFRVTIRFVQLEKTTDLSESPLLLEFVQEFHRRATSRIHLATPSDLDHSIGLAAISAAQEQLESLGISRTDMVLDPGLTTPAQGATEVLLSFRGAVAKVPNCGDWSGEAGFNPTNMPGKNYGCAYQRNIGLMLSNPNDLRNIKPVTVDTLRSDLVIQNFREGGVIGSESEEGSEGSDGE